MSSAAPSDRPPEPDTRLRDPPIAQLGVIGDRRTAALEAADGTLNWLCLCPYCVVDALTHFATVALTIPEPLKALGSARETTPASAASSS